MSATLELPSTPVRDVAQLRAEAQVLARDGRHAEALRLLEQTERLAPADVGVQIDMAVALFEVQRFLAAMERLDRVLAAQPELVECRFLQGLCQHRLGNLPLAIEAFSEVTTGADGAALERRAPDMARTAHETLVQLRAQMAPAADAPVDGRLADRPLDPTRPRWAATGAAKYDFSHLTQAGHQRVAGPVQDDEALLLYATVRVMRIRRILEVGGLAGYLARNFLRAMDGDEGVAMYTIDLNPVPSIGSQHHTIVRDCAQLQPADVHHLPLDMVFLDAHVLEPQIRLIERLEEHGLIHSHTVIALHDTNLHRGGPTRPMVEDNDGQVGFPHQRVERQIVNVLHRRGWEALNFHMPIARGDDVLPFRHGVTLMRRFTELAA